MRPSWGYYSLEIATRDDLGTRLANTVNNNVDSDKKLGLQSMTLGGPPLQ